MSETDRLSAHLSAHYSAHLVCRAGCSACCRHHISVFPVEAAAIAAAVEDLPDEVRARVETQADEVVQREGRGAEAYCPLLVDDRCTIYSARPLICRTQGLPLIYEAEDGEQEVDFCPLNFTAPDAANELDENHLVPLDLLNLRLAAVNLDYCRSQGIPAGRRIAIAKIVLSAGTER
ncbi:MAG: YkgJ family cysteine cluster protein [Blastocatellales bacterium]|nr:YkgJ family cysteine cluster protein [Blastocatellales bacterium]